MLPAVYLQGKDWHITAAEELSGKELSQTQKIINLQEMAASAKTILEHFAQSMAILALEVEEARPVEKVNSGVRILFMHFIFPHTFAVSLNINAVSSQHSSFIGKNKQCTTALGMLVSIIFRFYVTEP